MRHRILEAGVQVSQPGSIFLVRRGDLEDHLKCGEAGPNMVSVWGYNRGEWGGGVQGMGLWTIGVTATPKTTQPRIFLEVTHICI